MDRWLPSVETGTVMVDAARRISGARFVSVVDRGRMVGRLEAEVLNRRVEDDRGGEPVEAAMMDAGDLGRVAADYTPGGGAHTPSGR